MMKMNSYKTLFLTACVGLSVVGCGGSSNNDKENPSKPPINNQSISVQAQVKSADGSLLKGVKVKVLGQQAVTDLNGLARLNVQVLASQTEVVVTYEADGFIQQSILVKKEELAQLAANLLAIKAIVAVEDIALEQVIKAPSLGAKITIPANAFVDPKGNLAQGQVHVEFSPWDIQSTDLNAMPANGFAVDAQGNRTQLISAGMITATFSDVKTGQKLQLAPSKTADIQMDLPLKSINNQEMKVGTEIPMWHFDESKGLWVEEGKGKVVASTESPTGLAVHATVSHFSTWNWDFKFEAAGSVFIQCISDNKKVPCNVVAKIKLADGSSLTKTSYIPEQGTTAYNMPSEGTILWQATDLTSTLIGEKTSLTTGSVTIDLGKPKTDNFVQCVLPNGSATPCTATLNQSYPFSLTQEGGKITTGINDDDGQLEWSAVGPMIYESNQWVRYKGGLVSGLTGQVTIQLSEREVLFEDAEGLSFNAVCTTYDAVNQPGTQTVQPLAASWEVDPELTNLPCEINLWISLGDNEPPQELTVSATYGKPVKIQLPSKFSGFLSANEGVIQSIQLTGNVTQGAGRTYQGYANLYDRILPNQVLVINLWNYCTDDGDTVCEVPVS